MKDSIKSVTHCIYTYILIIFLTPLGIVSCLSLHAQINNFGPMFISGNAYSTVAFINGNSASYQNNGNFYLADDFTNNQASMAEGNGTTTFIGTSRQKVFGAQTPVFHNVYLDNSLGLQLNVSTIMGGTISPVSGSIYFNDYALTMKGMVSNAYANTRTFNVTNLSDLNIKGDAAAGNKLYFDSSANTLHNLTVTNSGTGVLGNALNIVAGSAFGTVIVNGSFDANGILTLKSDSVGTAQVGVSSGVITNEVVVERYFPAVRAWRFLSIPFSSSSQTINQAWQEGNVDNVLTCPPQHLGIAGYGTAISFNNDATRGFDYHNNNYKTSIQVYQNNAWVTPYSMLTTNLADYKAYSLFVRGDRSVCLTYTAIPNTTTLRPKGVLNEVNGAAIIQNFGTGTANGYVMLSNPFASSVDIFNVVKAANSSGIVFDRFLVWDPQLGGNLGVGGYVTYSSGIFVPANAGYTSGTVIQSSQSFMVQRNSTGAAGSVTIRQANKTSSETVSGVFGLRAAPPSAIFVDLVDTGNVLMDGVGAGIGSNYSATVDTVDAPKHWNEEIENMALVRDTKTLAIEFRPNPTANDTLFCRLYIRQHPYRLKVFTQNLSAGISNNAWIVDKYLGSQTQINLRDTSVYNFTPNSDTNSYRNRFMVVFAPATPDTKIAKAETIITKIKAHIYPNPVSGKTFNLTLQNAAPGNYSVNIYSLSGILAATRTINYADGTNTYSIPVPDNLTSGNYTVQVINSAGVIVSSMPMVVAK